MRRFTAVLLPLLLLFFVSCGSGETVRQIYVMDSVADIRILSENRTAADEICSSLYEIDRELSSFDGAVAKINENGGGELTHHISSILHSSIELSKKTGGAFSPALGAVTELWGVGSKNRVPAQHEISEALRGTDIENVKTEEKHITLTNGARLNFGAVAKGYASDAVREILICNEIEGAVISLGGNVYVHGVKADGGKWNVAIRDPEGEASDWIGSLALENKFVISSGDYERYFEYNGNRYHHIMDPETGSPAKSDLLAVAVICENGIVGDAYSTALYVMGREDALKFWRAERDFELVLIGRDGTVTLTEGIAEAFTPNSEKRYTYEIAYR